VVLEGGKHAGREGLWGGRLLRVVDANGLVGVVRRRDILGWQMRGGYCREAIQSAAEEFTKEGLPVRVLS